MFRTAHPTARRPRFGALRGAVLCGLVLALSGCASIRDSRANPFNWFGSTSPVIARSDDLEDATGTATTAEAPATVNPLIPQRRASVFRDDDEVVYPGTRVAEITELAVDSVPGGAVIRATGIAESLAAFDVRLTAVETDDPALLRLEMRALQPPSTRGQGSAQARSVSAALSLTEQDLAQVRTIEVVARGNARSVRR